MSSKAESVTAFLNVDVDIRAPSGLEDLLTAIGASGFALHRTEQDASMELNGDTNLSLEDTVVRWAKLIESLPPSARNIWNRCESRKFNIGVQAGNEPHSARFELSSNAISLLSSVHAELVFTVYAPLKEQVRKR